MPGAEGLHGGREIARREEGVALAVQSHRVRGVAEIKSKEERKAEETGEETKQRSKEHPRILEQFRITKDQSLSILV